jgi:transcriptional regulator with XRE-family HTH domain
MTYPSYIKEKARELRRKKDMTIDEIAERLAVSRTTIFYWVGEIPIPRTEDQALAQQRASRTTRRKARELREAAYDEGEKWFPYLDGQETFRDFVCMYIGEGYKRDRNSVSICNSDPAVIKLATYWLRRLSQRQYLMFSIQYHADQDLKTLRTFWAAELGIEPDEIKFQRKSNSGQLRKRVWRSRYGVMTVRVSDTMLRAELQAWMDLVQDEWALDSAELGA